MVTNTNPSSSTQTDLNTVGVILVLNNPYRRDFEGSRPMHNHVAGPDLKTIQ